MAVVVLEEVEEEGWVVHAQMMESRIMGSYQKRGYRNHSLNTVALTMSCKVRENALVPEDTYAKDTKDMPHSQKNCLSKALEVYIH